ncbi:bacillithiol biosynthesis cysteine-adding enzyme BshC [Paenibacillus kobensis]|uniref:bacillithiol biosynthesis cysteine-adding enzyme BshC n=1 Tax=Paenibacillus kobensis TaxID=59841 RepID=UPI000FD968E8|nr:bacillithiol biosynthesis cysteine-adding enzyme BshC [Paenibacillus kobensis]
MTSTNFYELPSSQPLSDAYVKQTDSRLNALFHSGHPADEEHWRARSSRLDGAKELRVPSADIADALRRYNARFGMSQETAANIEAIGQGAQVVVGGQQAGLWTGPILVIHKAVTIIAAAKHASKVLNRAVVPVFWIAGEDHDWDEANHITAATEQGLRKLAVTRPEGPRTSVSRTAVAPEAWESAIAELETVLTGSEFKEPLLDKLRELTKSAKTLSDGFAGILAWLFGGYGLVLIDADDAAVRALEAPMFRRMLADNDALEAAYTANGQMLDSLGYRMQAAAAPDCANLFLFRDGGSSSGLQGDRVLLYKRDGGFTDKKGESFWSADELLSLADSSPGQFSNNVLTRPIMQDYLFPVLAAVLGAGEIAYWAQIGGAFRHFGMEMPILVPRMSFTLVEGTIAKHMMKYDLTFDDVVRRFEERKQQWLMAQDRFDIAGRFGAAKRDFESLYAPLVELAGEVQAGLAALGTTNMNKILEQIDFLQNRTQDAFRKSHDASIRHWDRIGTAIWPGGKPQERVLNMTAYYNRYGTDWLAKLLALPYVPSGEHQIVYL